MSQNMDPKTPPKPNVKSPAVYDLRTDEMWMKEALSMARMAKVAGEVPIGAIVVKGGTILAASHNAKEMLQDPTAHAEVSAIRQAAIGQKNWRLEGATLYTTLEPCPMCYGAALQSRIARIVYGAKDHRWGVIESTIKLPELVKFNHQVEITAGVLAEESAQLLQEFFKSLRES
jgi:tRNA(adenine34) deaminase